MSELKHMMIAKNRNKDIDVFPTDSLGFWRVVMAGPGDTPYAGGAFQLWVKFPSDYPSRAPEIRFLTPIKHTNVNGNGKICHNILDRDWDANKKAIDALNHVLQLLVIPEPDTPLDSVLAGLYKTDKGKYEQTVKDCVST